MNLYCTGGWAAISFLRGIRPLTDAFRFILSQRIVQLLLPVPVLFVSYLALWCSCLFPLTCYGSVLPSFSLSHSLSLSLSLSLSVRVCTTSISFRCQTPSWLGSEHQRPASRGIASQHRGYRFCPDGRHATPCGKTSYTCCPRGYHQW